MAGYDGECNIVGRSGTPCNNVGGDNNVRVMEFHTTGSQVATVVFGSTDVAAPADLYIPGTPDVRQYSYQKFLQLDMDSGAYATDLTFYTDGTNSLGVDVWVGLADADTAHIVPSSVDSPPLLNGVAMVDAFSYTAGSPLDIDAGDGLYTSGPIGKFVVLVAESVLATSVGLKVGENIIFGWNEV